ncbi:hypothetical protein Glove_367g29 [Diversispora epigaea]|uniref:TLDc domain-containing protein n=1 Tax=Diversispora epigaea TaxID=1348612 RepID=A0A397H706_9GLOM|nr:hypothetical protein Glove_367g29 [Diversispora epigaea]
MLTAVEFDLEELTNKLEIHLIETKASWLKTHFSLVYRTIFDRQNFKNLENYCNDIIVKYPNLIFDANDFTSLPESALISLLKRDDLQMEEVEIWDYIVKWGIAQNPTLPTNLEDWTKDNFLPFSAIISEDHAAEISTWIDRKSTTYSTTYIPYKFELILRGSRDGFAPQTFWNICHGHAHTVVVTKVKGTDEIIGGFNPLAWDNSNHRSMGGNKR